MIELLNAQRNALALRVYRKNGGFDFLAFLVIAHCFLTGCIPRNVGDVHQPINVTRQSDENTKVGDRFYITADAISLVEVGSKLSPGIRNALLDPERNSPALPVNIEDHHLNFISNLYNLRWVDVLIGPVHFRDMHQPFNAFLNLNETTVIRNIGNLAGQSGINWKSTSNGFPRIRAQLFNT